MKKITIVLVLILAMLTMTACGNQQWFDTTYYFGKGVVALPNGEVIEGKVESWTDYESDAVQVVIDGTTYLTHYANVCLIAE